MMKDVEREEKKDIIAQFAELEKADKRLLDVAKAYWDGMQAGMAISATAQKKEEEENRDPQ